MKPTSGGSSDTNWRKITAYLLMLIVAVVASWQFSQGVKRDLRNTDAREVDALRTYQILSCERNKLDRVDIARALTAMTRYYEAITQAKSVKRDVRLLAGGVGEVLSESANQLRTHILLCRPLVLQGREILDERLLREAQGGI